MTEIPIDGRRPSRMLRMPEPIVRHCEPDQDVFEDFGDKKEAGNTIDNNNFNCT